jgi:hypothetical protein
MPVPPAAAGGARLRRLRAADDEDACLACPWRPSEGSCAAAEGLLCTALALLPPELSGCGGTPAAGPLFVAFLLT